MVKTIIVILVGGITVSVAYFAGAFITSFNANQCYSIAISDVALEARKALKDSNPFKVAEYEGFVAKLPLYGYETNCSDVAAAIDIYRKNANAK